MIKSFGIPKGVFLFPCSSMVERLAVNEDVRGSSPRGGAFPGIEGWRHPIGLSYQAFLQVLTPEKFQELLV